MTSGLWWSATEDIPPMATCRILDYNLDNMWRDERSKVYGIAIRCLAD